MRKLKLNLDQIAVDSFDTAAGKAEKGTVFGEQCTCQTACTCPGCHTCYGSCNTCNMSCGCPTEGWYSCGPDCNTGDDPTVQSHVGRPPHLLPRIIGATRAALPGLTGAARSLILSLLFAKRTGSSIGRAGDS